MKSNPYPYKPLGSALRKLREKQKESQIDVCGAVEIGLDQLVAIESGKRRPSEDILILLINHFNPQDEIVTKLWEMSGYAPKRNKQPLSQQSKLPEFHSQPAIMVLPMDARIVYSDSVHVMVNDHGVVMNFMQNVGPDGKPIAISRIGMSRDHAKSVVAVLQQTLAQHEQKSLPTQTIDPDISTTA